jgi:phage gpG-like protein
MEVEHARLYERKLQDVLSVFTCTLTVPDARFKQMRSALTTMDGPLAEVGHFVVDKWMPELFSSGGKGTWPSVMRGGQPLLDKGRDGGLLSAFAWGLGSDGQSVIVGNVKKYTALQNFGGTVTAKAGKFLAIPLPGLSVSERRIGTSAFRGKDTFFAKSRKGNLILFENLGTKGKGKNKTSNIRPLFVMKESVTIKPRPFMKWFPEMKTQAIEIARAAILKAMGGQAA